MSAGKFISDDWKVVVNGVDLSDHADSVDTPLTKDRVDVSGFGGGREYLPGLEDGTITIEFFSDFGAASTHATLYPLYAGGSAFPMYVQPFASEGTSATNPICGGSASLYDYNGGAATLNEAAKMTVEFKPAPNSQFVWGTVAP